MQYITLIYDFNSFEFPFGGPGAPKTILLGMWKSPWILCVLKSHIWILLKFLYISEKTEIFKNFYSYIFLTLTNAARDRGIQSVRVLDH